MNPTTAVNVEHVKKSWGLDVRPHVISLVAADIFNRFSIEYTGTKMPLIVVVIFFGDAGHVVACAQQLL
jgi:hypothetical protein